MDRSAGLDLPGRAALLGLTCNEFLRLAEFDRRIVADIAMGTDAAIARVRRWLELGRPAPDLERLAVVGDAPIVAAVRELVANILPRPVGMHVSECCFIVGVGAEVEGWAMCALPKMPEPDHDRVHLIALASADTAMICHEFAHSWDYALSPGAPAYTALDAEQSHSEFMSAVVELGEGMQDAYKKHVLRRERRADALARLWTGSHIDTCGPARHRHIAQRLRLAAGMKEPTP